MRDTVPERPVVQHRGAVIHWARGYDLVVWLFLFGRERRFREKSSPYVSRDVSTPHPRRRQAP